MTDFESALRGMFRDVVREVVREELQHDIRHSDHAEYLTLKAASKIVGVSVSTVRDWVRDGLKTYGAGRIKRVKLNELRDYFEQLRASRQPKTEPEEVAARILATIGAKGRLR